MKVKIFYNDSVIEKKYDSPVLLTDIIRKNAPEFIFPCSGAGKCGKCIVECYGELSEPSDREKELLNDKIHCGYRLACMTKAIGDCNIHIVSATTLKNAAENYAFHKNEPVTGDNRCYAGVVDIGTTCVDAYIYKMPEFKLVKHATQRNRQSIYGADVLSRITYAQKNGLQELYLAINRQIDMLLQYNGKMADFRVVTGNTTMLSFYKNVDVSSMAVSPFTPEDLFGSISTYECIPRCISAFIGSDITCGIISCGMLEYENALLIDIGTNGEIVYKKGDRFICCSASAGPAFEGADIKNGIQSVDGAINKVYNIGNRVEYTTIGRIKPVGICGSGLVDAVAVMLNLGIIDRTGYLESDFYIGDSDVFITPEDIRHIQTAKSAIRSAIEIVCDDIDNVEKIFISGSFGSFLDIDSAVTIGLIPEIFKNKFALCGNTAASGAAMILADKNMFFVANEIAQRAETVQLAGNNVFFEKYIANMNF